MKKGVLVKTTPVLIGLFSLTSCVNSQSLEPTQIDLPKLLIQIGIGVAGIVLTGSIKKDCSSKDTVIGKKINRRFK